MLPLTALSQMFTRAGETGVRGRSHTFVTGLVPNIL